MENLYKNNLKIINLLLETKGGDMPITHELINGPAPLTSKPNQDSTEYTVEQQAIGFGIPAESLIGDPKTEALMRRMQDEAANVAMTCTGLSTLYAVTEAARGEG